METKKCVKCGKELPLTEFYVRKDNGKPRGECISCVVLKGQAYYKENKKQHAELIKNRYDNFGRFARYGITKEMYLDALKNQGGRCGLCGTPDPGGKGKWHIDHVHDKTFTKNSFKQCHKESVRGLLCHNCNISLGHYEKLIDRVGKQAIDVYINKD